MKDLFNDKNRFKIKKLTLRANKLPEATVIKPLHELAEQAYSDTTREGDDVEVRWQYDKTTWHIVTDSPYREPPDLLDKFVTWFAILGCIGVLIAALIAAFIAVFVHVLQLQGLPLMIAGLVVGIVVFCVWAQGDELEPSSGEVVIRLTQVRIGNATHELVPPESSTTPMIVIPGQLTFLRAFTQRWFSSTTYGDGWSYGNIDILVPPGKEDEAEQLAKWFYGVYEKRRRSMKSVEEEIEDEEIEEDE